MIRTSALILILCLISWDALACRCTYLQGQPADEIRGEIDRSDAVFIGDPISIKTLDLETETSVAPYQIIEFSVLEAWKGARAGTTFETRTSIRFSCGYILRESVPHLIFADSTRDGYYTIGFCTYSGKVIDSEHIIELLRQEQLESNKGFNRTPECSGPAKPGESGGGSG